MHIIRHIHHSGLQPFLSMPFVPSFFLFSVSFLALTVIRLLLLLRLLFVGHAIEPGATLCSSFSLQFCSSFRCPPLLPTSTLVALGEPQLAHNVICRVVYLANNKNRTGSQWLEENLRESKEYKTPIGRPVASGRTLSDRTSGAGSPSDRAPCFCAYRSLHGGFVRGSGTR